MHAEMTLSGPGLKEMDGAAMMAVSGGGPFADAAAKILVSFVICVVTSADSLVDGIQAGWNAA